MRPHLLEFTAMGSYPDAVVVDFDALAPQGLFHIHGPTGAGKSTLIDAMCFALYGTIPSPRRADGLRSHHSDPKAEAIARLTFSAQGQTWKIVRTPAQLRAKLRGDGSTEQRATVSLQRKEGGGWAPVTSGQKEVDPIIQRLLGLDADQFMQVVVLPQGGFQKVLRAGADEREELLRHLFGSERFRNYTQHLKERSDALQRKVEAQTRFHATNAKRIAHDLERFSIEIDGFPDHVDEPVLRVLGSVKTQVTDTAIERDNNATAATKAAEKAEIVLRRRSIESERWQSRVGAEARIASLEDERNEIDLIRAELTHADRAAPLAPLQEAVEEADHAFLAATSTRQVAQAAIASIRDDLDAETEISSELTKLIDGVPPALTIDAIRKQIRDRLNEVSIAADLARQTLNERKDIEHFTTEKAQRTTALEETIKRLVEMRTDLAEKSLALDKLRADSNQFATASEQLRVLELKIEHANSLQTEQKRTAQIQSQLNEAAAEQSKSTQSLLDLLKRRSQSRAGELASQLVDGVPCAVCGSEQHPAPTQWIDVINEHEIEAAQERADKCTITLDTIRVRLVAAQHRETAYRTAAADVIDNRASAYSHREQLQLQVAAIARAASELKSTETSLANLETKLKHLETREDVVREQLVEVSTRLSESQSRLAQIEARLHEQGGLEVIELSGSLDAAHEALDSLANSIEDERHCVEALKTTRTRLAEVAAERKVENIPHALAYLRNERQLTMLRDRVKHWEQALATAQATLENPVVAAVTEEPDLEAAKLVLSAARNAESEAVKLAASSTSHADQLVKLIDELLTEMDGFSDLVAEYERVHTLWEICHGGKANTKRQSLERYVLASYLEEVADAASKRLQHMSSGRYSLRHSDARVRGNAASGLSLLVTDAHTGQEREVSTLSGGETFLASLALALGLSDIVQAKSGGIHIEALFIDEGFGSLDPDALELALIELDRLREGGRLVGVISHVATLRDRIPAGIEVISSPSGSKIRQSNGFAAAV